MWFIGVVVGLTGIMVIVSMNARRRRSKNGSKGGKKKTEHRQDSVRKRVGERRENYITLSSVSTYVAM